MTLLFTYLAIAIGVSFLCSVLEAVLLSINPSFVAQMAATKPRAGARINHMRDHLDESLSSILILNTFAHTMGAAGVGSQAVQIFGAEWETLIAVLLTLVILYFSEIIPKTLGATFWRQLAIPAAFVIVWLVKLAYPLVWLSTRLTRLFSDKESDEITREEIIALASIGHREGALFSDESEYLANILSLREVRTGEILTPRSVVHMVSRDMTVSEALNLPGTKQFSRMPVYGDSTENIIGKVIKRDLFEAERAGHGNERVEKYRLPIVRVSEKLPIHQLLDQLIKHHAHIFLVEDEFGQNSGVVTLEDAIETLLGREIVDESDKVEDMQALAKAKYRKRLRGEKLDQQDDIKTS